eukprot:6339001-Ditylum_brightwellii.AAC.1
MAQLAHHNIAKLIFLSQRARPDIQTRVTFLSTRATRDMPLTLKADALDHMCWWVDASFAVHPDTKRHTGGMMMRRKGAIYAGSTK